MNVKKAIKRFFCVPSRFFMNQNEKYSKYEIGEWTYGNPSIRSGRAGKALKIGRFCALAYGVVIVLGEEHRTDWVTTYPFSRLFPKAKRFPGHPRSKGDVIIGNDVWIGRDALILSGVEIGNGAVIAARSVVTKDVAPYSIVAGNPAKLVRFRFNKSITADLQKIAWWNWSMLKIAEALPLLLSSNKEAFIVQCKT